MTRSLPTLKKPKKDDAATTADPHRRLLEPLPFVADAEAVGQRLDAWLSAALPDVSRSGVARALDEGRITLGGLVPKKAGHRLKSGDEVIFTPVEWRPAAMAVAEDLPVDIVFEDAHLAVIDKAAGMVVHPAPGHRSGTLVNALLFHLDGGLAEQTEVSDAERDVARPGIVHRLDRETSGLLVVAKSDTALRNLQAQFKAHSTERRYLAVVSGPKLEDAGTIESLYGRHPHHRKRMSAQVEKGKRAVTHWDVLARAQAFALLMLRLETGRTHQIRVHMAESGHHVVGDPLYGKPVPKGHGGRLAGELLAARRIKRQALHAAVLGLQHPVTGETLRFVSRPPRDMDVLMRRCFGEDSVDKVLAALDD